MTIHREPTRNGTSVLPVLATAAFGTAWFAFTALRQQHGLPGSLLVMWLLPPLALALCLGVLRRTATTAGLPPAARRFWNHIVLTVALAAAGLLVEAVYVLATTERSPAQVRADEVRDPPQIVG